MKTNTITNIESALQSFMRNGVSLKSTIANTEHSVEEKVTSGRTYTCSELGRLMEELNNLESR